jgi:hypothetical protein
MRQGVYITLWSVLFFPLDLSVEPVWQVHGKLEVSKDGHRIQHTDGTPFLWIGNTTWGMF